MMAKETKSRGKPLGVVARLMGLDERPVSPSRRTSLCDYEEMQFGDMYEVSQQPSSVSVISELPAQQGICRENNDEQKMALIRQKFMEAKRLATDGKLLHCKEFQEALEILSSNKDLFLKFLGEPIRLFSEQIKDHNTVGCSPPGTRRITVLKPTGTAEIKNENSFRRESCPIADDREFEPCKGHWNSSYTHSKGGALSQPTRIVVLKPNTSTHFHTKAKKSFRTSTEQLLHQNNSSGGSEDPGSADTSIHITEQMQKASRFHRRDETLLPTVCACAYCGDESLFHRSETEYSEEGYDSLSDLEALHSSESSVIREAKKHLSKRWTLITSNGKNQERTHLRRSMRTLGEMLAIPDTEKEGSAPRSGEPTTSGRKYCDDKDEFRLSTSCLPISKAVDAGNYHSPRNLSSSKSVSVSFSPYDDVSSNADIIVSQIIQSSKLNDVEKHKKGKLLSFFFPWSRKSNREKSVSSTLVYPDDQVQSAGVEPAMSQNKGLPRIVPGYFPVDDPFEICKGSENAGSRTSVSDGAKKAAVSLKDHDSCNQDVCRTCRSPYARYQDQASPNLVLNKPFDEEGNNIMLHPFEADYQELKLLCGESCIESVDRTSSGCDNQMISSSPEQLKLYHPLPDDHGQELFELVRKLIFSGNMVFAGWHSLSSPLDPMLCEKFLNHKDEAAMGRKKRSEVRLLFDSVNSAITETGWITFLNAYPWSRSSLVHHKDVYASAAVSPYVWSLVKNWFYGTGMWASTETSNNSRVVDRVLSKEVEGKVWQASMRSEIEEFSKEISGEVLKDLIREVLLDLQHVCDKVL